VLDKEIGETPLAAIQAWKKERPEYAGVPACYAGRLDPMASGKLLVLLGDECKRQRAYTDLDKEYEIEVLLDVGSDTGDALGIPEYAQQQTDVDEKIIAGIIRSEHGAHLRAYPKFSSKTVHGKPLFLHTLEGTLTDIKIPEHFEHIYRIKNKNSFVISSAELEARIGKFLDCVPRTDEPSKQLGKDFRVDAIRTHWQALFETAHERNFIVLRLQVACASGTYMRSLAGRIGTELGTKALALLIKRTKIGAYFPLWHGMGFWLRTY
jgi:tRNA U55 pseudouridine synthase TruB